MLLMRRVIVRCGRLAAISAVTAACSGDPTPTAPTVTVPPTTATPLPTATLPPNATLPPTAPRPTPSPAPIGAGHTYRFAGALEYRVRGYTETSRFVLYDNGVFALEYPSIGGAYRGSYRIDSNVVHFAFDGWSVAGSWDATGSLANGSMRVRYNIIMSMSDFEDAVYSLND